MIGWSDIAPVASAFAGAGVAAVGIAWRLRGWLADQFSSTRKSLYEAMAEHEKLDQARHEQNLQRFSDIRVELAGRGAAERRVNGW